jgi:hypothetical protein
MFPVPGPLEDIDDLFLLLQAFLYVGHYRSVLAFAGIEKCTDMDGCLDAFPADGQ